MSGLIKREEVLKVIHDYFKEFIDYIEAHEEERHLRDIFMVLAENKKLCTKIKEIPVAYDVEQVVKELEEQYGVKKYEDDVLVAYEQAYIHIDEAIEIVRGGGVND